MASGYSASSASPSPSSIPMFDGNKDKFEDFTFKFRVVMNELNLSDIVLAPNNYKTRVDQALANSLETDAEGGSNETRAAAATLHGQLQHDEKVVTRFLITHLSPNVAAHMRRVVSADKHLDALAIWTHLQTTYGTHDAARRAADNPERAIVHALNIRFDPKSTKVVVFARNVATRVKQATSAVKYTDPTRCAILAIAVSHILDAIAHDARYNAIYDKYWAIVVDNEREVAPLATLDELIAAIELADASRPPSKSSSFHKKGVSSQQGKQAGNTGKPGNSGGAASTKAPAVVDKRKGGAPKVHAANVERGGVACECVGECVCGANGVSGVHIDGYISAIVSSTSSTSSTPSTSSTVTKSQVIFLIDSGATHHCVRERSLFSTFRPGKHVVRVAGNKTIAAIGKGDVTVAVQSSAGTPLQLTLHEVFLVPSLTNNIFSTNRFLNANHAHQVVLGSGDDKSLRNAAHKIPLISEHDLVWMIASRPSKKKGGGGVFFNTPPAPATTGVPAPTVQAVPTMPLQLFHERMGHLNFKDCIDLANGANIKLTNTDKTVCEVCELTKQRKKPMPALAARDPVAPGQVLHCDIKGPLASSFNRAKYALVVVDEATRVCKAKEMKSKDQVVDVLRSIIVNFGKHPGEKITIGEHTTLHADSEAVLKSQGMSEYLSSIRMSTTASPPYTHERNGIAERAIQTLFNMVRALLAQAELPEQFWPLALQHAVYLRNRAPTQALGGHSPLQELTGAVPSLKKLVKFGALVYIKVDDSSRKAMDAKSRTGIYVGHSELSNSHRVLVRNSNRWDVVDTIHCDIDESTLGSTVVKTSSAQPAPPPPPQPPSTTHSSTPIQPPSPKSPPKLLAERDPLLDLSDGEDDGPPAPIRHPAPPPPPAKSKPKSVAERDPLSLDYSDDDDGDPSVSALQAFGDGSAPINYRAAMQSAEATSWAGAVKNEVDSLESNGTFELVPESAAQGHKVLATRWVFTKKHEANGTTRHKARLVARGDRQRAGIDYDQVYSPVVNANTVRTMLAIAAVHDYELDQMDAVTAFLNAPLEENLFLHIPDGFTPQPGYVLRLKKSLYGLKQAPRYWNKMLHDWLVITYGMQQSKIDPCLYFLPSKQLWVAFWVDDFLVMAANAKDKDLFKAAISKQFKMRDLGALDQFLGMSIKRDRSRRVLTLQSTKHIDDMLERFGMTDAKAQSTPLPHKCILMPSTDADERLPPSFPYRAIVGSLLYVAMWTRPDIAFAVSQVARHQQQPTQHHWQCAKHILRYLKGTREVGLTYSAKSPTSLSLRGYVDASYGEDLSTRRSQTGYVFTLGGAAITWKSVLQNTVALSSTEAEYIALTPASQEALYLHNLLQDLCPSMSSGAVTLLEDNQSTIKQASNLLSSERVRHVDIKYHFIKQYVARGDIALQYIPTEDQLADALTKNLDRIKVSTFRQTMLGTI